MAQWYNGRWVCGSIHTFDGSICQRTPVKGANYCPLHGAYRGRSKLRTETGAERAKRLKDYIPKRERGQDI